MDRKTSTRADKVLSHLFVDISGENSAASIGGKPYLLLMCGNFSCFAWTYVMRQKSATVIALFEQF